VEDGDNGRVAGTMFEYCKMSTLTDLVGLLCHSRIASLFQSQLHPLTHDSPIR
jgi:hypothetical protein